MAESYPSHPFSSILFVPVYTVAVDVTEHYQNRLFGELISTMCMF